MLKATDRQWERIGRDEPYYGVLVQPRFRSTQLSQENLHEFFHSGEEHVAHLMHRLREQFGHECRFTRALDFGCGVGRIVLPLARHSVEVIGVDVSESMLSEARRNCRRFGCDNVAFLKSDDHLSQLQGQFDLVHSFIVLQHIPAHRGFQIIARLTEHLADTGVGVLHITYAKHSLRRKWIYLFRRLTLVSNVINVLRKKPFFEPQMQMNDYDVNRVLRLLQAQGIQNFYAEYTNHGGYLGVILYFQKCARSADDIHYNRFGRQA